MPVWGAAGLGFAAIMSVCLRRRGVMAYKVTAMHVLFIAIFAASLAVAVIIIGFTMPESFGDRIPLLGLIFAGGACTAAALLVHFVWKQINRD